VPDYRLRRNRHWFVWYLRALAGFSTVLAIVLADARSLGLIAIAIGIEVLDLAMFRRLPVAIQTDEAGIRFVKPTGAVVLPWDSLTVVRRGGGTVPRLYWSFGEVVVTTWDGYERQRELLAEASRRAPRLTSLP